MKTAIFNLYQRDYFIFYILLTIGDFLFFSIFKIPILLILVCGIMVVLSSAQILKKFKK